MVNDQQEVFLITAGSGKTGRNLIPLLLNDPSKPKVVVPTSDAGRLRRAFSSASAEQLFIEEGSIHDPSWVQNLLTTHGVTSVYLCLTGENEFFHTMNFLDAMVKAQTVQHLVYVSALGDFSLPSTINKGALQNILCAHVVVKFIVEGKLQYGMPDPSSPSGFTHTVLGPSLFYDNDFRSKKSLMEKGHFDEPLGTKGVSRVAPSDIALVAYKTLFPQQGKKYHNKKIMIGSQKTYTNKEIASIWAKNLGKDVTFQTSDSKSLDAFEDRFRGEMGASWARDVRLMYEIFEDHEFGLTEEEYKFQLEVLGKEPESYEKFVEETAKKWLQE